MSALPVNLSPIDTSPEAIERAARYGLQTAQACSDWVSNTPATIQGARVLEIGPGVDYASVIGLRGRGAESVAVADRWLSPWREDYHPVVYRRMSEIMRDADHLAIAREYELVATHGHRDFVRENPSAAEKINAPSESFDMVFSNAVLEHLADQEAANRELYRVTARGGWHFHQVDYRDHRDMNRPLEHLLLSAEEWRAISENEAEPHCHGMQTRMSEHVAMLEAAGFEIFGSYVNCTPTEAYLDDFVLRLRAAGVKAYPRSELRNLGAVLILRKA